MKLTIDFETRSKVNLKKTGPWVYSEDPSTRILCLAVKEDDQPTGILIPKYFYNIVQGWLQNEFGEAWDLDITEQFKIYTYNQVKDLINRASIIEAHNAFFEHCIFENTLTGLFDIPFKKWRCSAAKAAALALPRSLDDVCKALGLSMRKDKQGYFLMHKLSKPRKPTKNNPAIWHEDPEDLLGLFKYCIQDVEAEYALSSVLPDLSPKEQTIWSIDFEINRRGLYVDTVAASNAIELIENHKDRLLKEFNTLTNKEVNSPTQLLKTLEWLKTKGLHLDDLTKGTVKTALKKDLSPDIRRALEIRQSLSKSSTAKFQSMVLGASEDQRMRDTTMYWGASTGRWAGKRVQPHNMVRKMPDDYCYIIDLIKQRDADTIEMLYGDLMQTLSGCIRGFICARPGHDLLCADYSSIEGRGLAWLAGEDYILRNYYQGKCAYSVFASQITGKPYDEIYNGYKSGIGEYEDIRFEGKTGELACGYQGGEQAIKRFAPDMPVKRRKEIVKLWRANRPKTVKFWWDMERYALSAVKTGLTYTWGRIKWGVKNRFLHCRLPSGRLLSYYDPQIRNVIMYAYRKVNEEGEVEVTWSRSKNAKDKGARSPKDDFSKESVTFMGVNSETTKWERQYTYGGKLVENIVQAVCRDLLAEALVRLEQNGYPVVLHVHDEVVSEVIENTGSVDEFCRLMAEPPAWADGFPINAEGFRTKRYRKG